MSKVIIKKLTSPCLYDKVSSSTKEEKRIAIYNRKVVETIWVIGPSTQILRPEYFGYFNRSDNFYNILRLGHGKLRQTLSLKNISSRQVLANLWLGVKSHQNRKCSSFCYRSYLGVLIESLPMELVCKHFYIHMYRNHFTDIWVDYYVYLCDVFILKREQKISIASGITLLLQLLLIDINHIRSTTIHFYKTPSFDTISAFYEIEGYFKNKRKKNYKIPFQKAERLRSSFEHLIECKDYYEFIARCTSNHRLQFLK